MTIFVFIFFLCIKCDIWQCFVQMLASRPTMVLYVYWFFALSPSHITHRPDDDFGTVSALELESAVSMETLLAIGVSQEKWKGLMKQRRLAMKRIEKQFVTLWSGAVVLHYDNTHKLIMVSLDFHLGSRVLFSLTFIRR
jgi:hypothetical protein